MKTTDREAQILQLRDELGLSWADIAERLGTSKGSVNSSYRNAQRKLKQEHPKPRANAVEMGKPKETALALDLATDPFTTIKAAAKACGFPESTLNALLRRMRTRYKPLDDAVRRVKDEEMIVLLEDRARRSLEYMDDYAMAGATLKDLAISAGVMIDKSRLLKDKPTQIFSLEDRRKITEILPIMLQEAERRGMIVDVDPATGEVQVEKEQASY